MWHQYLSNKFKKLITKNLHNFKICQHLCQIMNLDVSQFLSIYDPQ